MEVANTSSSTTITRRSRSAGTNSWKVTGANRTWSIRVRSSRPTTAVDRGASGMLRKALRITEPAGRFATKSVAAAGSLVTRVRGTESPTSRATCS